MLTLMRKSGERIVIVLPSGERIVVKINRIGTRSQARLKQDAPGMQCLVGIEAPMNCAVHREEVMREIDAERAGAGAAPRRAGGEA